MSIRIMLFVTANGGRTHLSGCQAVGILALLLLSAQIGFALSESSKVKECSTATLWRTESERRVRGRVRKLT
jgi:hypothetical protein